MAMVTSLGETVMALRVGGAAAAGVSDEPPPPQAATMPASEKASSRADSRRPGDRSLGMVLVGLEWGQEGPWFSRTSLLPLRLTDRS
jgi:hypothetical protein